MLRRWINSLTDEELNRLQEFLDEVWRNIVPISILVCAITCTITWMVLDCMAL